MAAGDMRIDWARVQRVYDAYFPDAPMPFDGLRVQDKQDWARIAQRLAKGTARAAFTVIAETMTTRTNGTRTRSIRLLPLPDAPLVEIGYSWLLCEYPGAVLELTPGPGSEEVTRLGAEVWVDFTPLVR